MIYVIIADSAEYVGYKHIILLHNIKGKWFLIDFCGVRNISFNEICQSRVDKILDKFDYLVYNYSIKSTYKLGQIKFLSCVSMVKLYLGIDENFIITPTHLIDYLNGKPISLVNKICRFFYGMYLFFNKPRKSRDVGNCIQ